MRILAIDYGDARTGLCISDCTGLIPGEAWVLTQWDSDKLAEDIVVAANERNAERLVLGLPKNMDGTEGPRAEKARLFAEKLRLAGAPPIIMWDERRSTIEAHAILHASGKKEKKHRQNVDAVAASLILESYLNSLH